jgi:Fe-S-cluster-containing hydrogenase component 2
MKSYDQDGILRLSDLNLPSEKQLKKGVAFIECIQEIPCNPCVDVCPVDAISMKDVNAPPIVDYDKCTACAQCVGICPGLAIFVIKVVDSKVLVTIPYEFYPAPEVGDKVEILNRKGENIGIGIVKKVKKKGKTMIITIEAEKDLAMEIRNIKV